jgi:hypothetical protein
MPSNFDDKKKFIEQATEKLDSTFGDLAAELYKYVVNEFIDRLEREGNEIANTSKNLQLVATIENLYNDFAQKYLPSVTNQIITGTDKISAYNVDYFNEFATDERDYQATTQKVQKIIRDRLGITAEGNGKKVTLKIGGYMDSLLKDNTVKNQIKNISYNEVLKGGGFQDLKKGLETFIVGNEEKAGGFQQYYQQYAYDIYTQVDRHETKLIAVELNLQYFIYEGTVIKTTRPFCRKRAGKVFSMKEAEQWVNDPWIQENIDKGYIASYDPLTDVGLFGCRHLTRYITKATAKSLRPDIQ